MAQGYSTKRVAITGLVLAGLIACVPVLANRLNAKVSGASANSPIHRFQSQETPDETEDFFSFVTSLPSYEALEANIGEVATASSEFLQSAAKDDQESLPQRAHEYRESLRRAGDSFESLVDRVGRERAEAVLDELSLVVNFDRTLDEFILHSKTPEE